MNTDDFPTTAPFNAAKLDELIQAVQRNTKAIEAQTQWRVKKWLEPDEACDMLGIPATKTKYTRWQNLKPYEESGKIGYTATRPRMYWREDVEKIAEMIASGKAYVKQRRLIISK